MKAARVTTNTGVNQHAFTAWSEWYNVYRAGNRGYTAGMPMIFGIGLAPLLQWLIATGHGGRPSTADAHHPHQQAIRALRAVAHR